MDRKPVNPDTQRTDRQNRAYWKWLDNYAKALNNQGVTMQDIMKVIKKMEIRPTKELVHETMVKQLIQAKFGVDSTTKLKRSEMGQIEDEMVKFFSHYFPDVETQEWPFDPNLTVDGVELD